MHRFIIALIVITTQVNGHYVFELALKKWMNPFRAEFNMECCDRDDFYPNCSEFVQCETRFDICLQSFSTPDLNCPYGRYSTRYDPSFPDSDNINFTVGVNIAGNVPNPMSFNVLEPISNGLRVIVTAYEEDSDIAGDDYIDVMRFVVRPVSISERFQSVQVMGEEGIGNLLASYRIRCLDGFCGSSCNEQNCNNTESQGLTDQFQYYIILSILLSIFLISVVLVVCSCMIVMIVCRTIKSHKTDENMLQDDNSPQPRAPQSNLQINSYKDTLPPSLPHTVYISSHQQDDDCDSIYYTVPTTNSNTNLCLNPAYGTN